MALSNDYSLKFRKSNGSVETYYGYTSKVTNPSLAFRSSNGNTRYIPLTSSHSSSPLKVRYNNSIYGITKQSCTITVNCNIVATSGFDSWNCVLYVNDIILNNGGFSFPISLTVYVKNGTSLSFNIPAYTQSINGDSIDYVLMIIHSSQGERVTAQDLHFVANILGTNYTSNSYKAGGTDQTVLSGNYTLTYTFYF